jgi:hypothetical protein
MSKNSNTTPGKGPRLRNWYTPSYDPDTGRAAASSTEPRKSHSFDGEPCHPHAYAPDGGFHKLDRRRTQGGDIRKRPQG